MRDVGVLREALSAAEKPARAEAEITDRTRRNFIEASLSSLWGEKPRALIAADAFNRIDPALHGALLDEGFLDYWRSLPLGGPLFPNVPLDTYGKRASKVTTGCSIWLRNVVKITDPNKPFYSHRHTAM